jgi:hypothetical protein
MIKRNILLFVAALVFSSLMCGFAPIIHAQNADTSPPTIPAGFSATANQPSSISLSWSGSTDTVGVVGYYIYRNGAAIMSVSGTSFTDSSLAPGTYQYAVAAYDAAGNVSFKSNTATVTLVQDTDFLRVRRRHILRRHPYRLRFPGTHRPITMALRDIMSIEAA